MLENQCDIRLIMWLTQHDYLNFEYEDARGFRALHYTIFSNVNTSYEIPVNKHLSFMTAVLSPDSPSRDPSLLLRRFPITSNILHIPGRAIPAFLDPTKASPHQLMVYQIMNKVDPTNVSGTWKFFSNKVNFFQYREVAKSKRIFQIQKFEQVGWGHINFAARYYALIYSLKIDCFSLIKNVDGIPGLNRKKAEKAIKFFKLMIKLDKENSDPVQLICKLISPTFTGYGAIKSHWLIAALFGLLQKTIKREEIKKRKEMEFDELNGNPKKSYNK